MKKVTLVAMQIATALVVVLVALTACSGNHRRDVEGVPTRNPDKIELYANVDEHPNVVVFCIRGVAFYSTTRDYTSVGRVAELDAWCKEPK